MIGRSSAVARRFWSLTAVSLLVAASQAGCTVLLDSDKEQCSTDGDCRARGAAFEGNVCDQKKKICVASKDYCFTNAQCIDAANGRASLCDKRDHRCKELFSATCPRLLSKPDDLRDDNAVVYAMPWLSAANAEFATGENGLELARRDLVTAGNLPGTAASKGKPRPLVWLTCDMDPAVPDAFPTEPQMNHLADELNGITPLMIGHFLTTEANIQVNKALSKDMLVLGQVQVYPSYASAAGFKDHFYSFYPRSVDYYPAYAKLVPFHEQEIRKKIGNTRGIKVAVTIQTNGLEVSNLAAFEKNLVFNGKPVDTADTEHYRVIPLGTGDQAPETDPAFAKAITDLVDYTPDVIVCGVATSCTNLFQQFEKVKPGIAYYLLSEQQIGVDFTPQFSTEFDRHRVLGVLPEPAVPSDAEKAFGTYYTINFEGSPGGFGWGLYKFGFIAAFVTAALKDQPLTGANLGHVLSTQFKRSGLKITPQLADYAKAFTELQAGRPINFEDIEFDEQQQQRIFTLPVYCLDTDTKKLRRVIESGLRWDATTNDFTGTFNCWQR